MVDTVRSYSDLTGTLFADGQGNGEITAQDMRDLIATAWSLSGWGSYEDTQYSSGSPWQPTPGQWNSMPNNAGNSITSQVPLDVSSFYDESTGKITGRNGDGLAITAEFIAVPTSPTTTFLDFAFNIGGSLGPLGDGRIYQRTLSFPKGQGEARVHSFTVVGFTLDTWETNGALLQVYPTASVSIYKQRLVVSRTHRAR